MERVGWTSHEFSLLQLHRQREWPEGAFFWFSASRIRFYRFNYIKNNFRLFLATDQARFRLPDGLLSGLDNERLDQFPA